MEEFKVGDRFRIFCCEKPATIDLILVNKNTQKKEYKLKYGDGSSGWAEAKDLVWWEYIGNEKADLKRQELEAAMADHQEIVRLKEELKQRTDALNTSQNRIADLEKELATVTTERDEAIGHHTGEYQNRVALQGKAKDLEKQLDAVTNGAQGLRHCQRAYIGLEKMLAEVTADRDICLKERNDYCTQLQVMKQNHELVDTVSSKHRPVYKLNRMEAARELNLAIARILEKAE